MSEEYIKSRLEQGLHLIPSHMHDGITLYVLNGIPPGGGLRLLLENDFMGAAGRMDEENKQAFWNWAAFLYDYVPGSCKGSPEYVAKWLAHGGAGGMNQ